MPSLVDNNGLNNRTWLLSTGGLGSISASLQESTAINIEKSSRKFQKIKQTVEKLSRNPSRLRRLIPDPATPVVVAVIDSGFDAQNQSAISTHLWQNPQEQADGVDNSGNGLIDDITGWDFIGNDPFGEDADGHGTMMAGLIIKEAPMAQLMNLRVLDEKGLGSLSEVSSAIDYAVNNKAQVINLSLGTNQKDQQVAESIQRALQAGVIVVAASGNEGSALPDYPARLEGVWAAGTVDHNGKAWKLSNGNQGKGYQYINLVSKHVKSLRLNGGRGFVTGTSAAAARLSGIFASLLSLRASR